MKLTEEQREEIQHYLDIPSEMGILVRSEKVKQLLQSLISSEQAWKEDAETYERYAEEYRIKLNQAVDVLRGLDAHMDFSIPIVSGESMGTFKDASGINEFFAKAHDFLSSLGKENDNAT